MLALRARLIAAFQTIFKYIEKGVDPPLKMGRMRLPRETSEALKQASKQVKTGLEINFKKVLTQP